MSTFYSYCCSYSDGAGQEIPLNVGDVFGKPWYAWEKYFTVTAVYHLDVSDPYDIFFEAEVELGKSIDPSTQYVKETFITTREVLTTYSSDIRIAGVITENGSGLSGVSILDVSTDTYGKYLATKASPFTGTATPTKAGYSFVPESVDYNNLTKYAVDDYQASVPLPKKPINPTPANGATDVTLDQATISWEDGGGATSYNVYYGENEEGLTLVSEGQSETSFTITGIDYGSPFEYVVSRAWRIDAINEYGTTTGDVWTFTTIKLNPPLATGLSLDSGGGNEGTGTTGTPTGENNIITIKRLVVAAANTIWYEDI